MSCEESYLAIRRYLTDEREPYAPGTHGNTKRKIRKAATCYVVRNGTLYYQRRQRGLDEFTELEVVLQDGRRKELIDQAHITAGGEHLNQHLTWETISQKYWWRGILKQVKDSIKECSQCQTRLDRRGLADDGSGPRPVGRPGRRKAAVRLSDEEDEEEEEEDEDGDAEETDSVSSCHRKARIPKTAAKHELVFVDSKGVVQQYLPKHGQTMLDKLNQQRVDNQFCDITLLIEGETYRAHKAVLAACSDYFNELFVEKGAVSTHEAVVDLSGFTKASFLPLLDFAYTSHLTFNFCVMAEVATLARHLLMSEVLQICESVHKQVEEQRLMVYQRGDIHTVVSNRPAFAAAAQQAFIEESGAYLLTIQSDGQATVSHAGGGGGAEGDESLAAVVVAQALEEEGGEEGGQGVAVVTHGGVEEAGAAGGGGETVTLVARGGGQAALPGGESVTLISHGGGGGGGAGGGEEGETTMTVVTHSGQAGASESLAVVSACLAMEGEEPQEEGDAPAGPGAFLIDVEPATAAAAPPTEAVQQPPVVTAPPVAQEEAAQTTAAAQQKAEPAPQVVAETPKRKRGRPAKVKQEAVVVVAEEEVAVPAPAVKEPVAAAIAEEQGDAAGAGGGGGGGGGGGPYRRRLRQRSVGEGGYVRLHMGLEEEEQDKKPPTPQRPHNAPKVGQKPAKRGRPPKAGRIEEEAEPGSATATEPDASQREGGGGGAPGTEEEEEPGTEGPLAEAEPAEGAGAAGGPESAVDGEHTCPECGMMFQRRYALIMHTLKHEKARGYKCSLCSKEFQYGASLRAHLARHKQQKSQRPPTAARLAGEDDAPDGEGGAGGGGGGLSAVRTKREFVCDICGKTLPKLYSLRIHMLNHTGVRPHACRVCGKTFAHKHSLKMHRVLHNAAKQFHCTLCDKSFVSKRSLEEHTSIHTGESKYLCTQCGRAFHRASGLSKHLKRHQPKPDVRGFSCDHCDKSFYEAKDLQQHMNKHMGLKPFQCQVCGKCYSWKKDWYSHVKSHSVAEPYKCNVCGKEFFEKALFRRHVKKATHGKKGRVKQNLERECEHCGRKFTQLREYRRHMNNHQGVKPFECLTCGVAWADARSLKRHVRTHTGERPYVCPMCGEAHIDARTLRKHMTKYHGDQLPGKIMLEKDTLQFHNQGTQVEHAVSILASDLPPELQPAPGATPSEEEEEIETVLITEETVEAVEAVQAAAAAAGGDGSVATLSDQSIMQVVNYVLAQQAVVLPAGVKLDDGGPEEEEVLQAMEVEVAHVAEVE